MKLRIPYSAALCLVSVFCLAQSDRDFVLPSDPSAEVISFDVRGGESLPHPGPLLIIRADGSVRVLGANLPPTPIIIESKISASQLQSLLRSIINEQNFFGFNPVAVDGEMRKAQGPKILTDVQDTVIRIHLADREHEVEFHGLLQNARFYPGIKSLNELLVIQNRLYELRAELRAAGSR